MTNKRNSTVFSMIAAAMIATMPMGAHAGTFVSGGEIEVSKTNGMERRDDRRDDRQDCRITKGAIGHDKRDCKQDSRRG